MDETVVVPKQPDSSFLVFLSQRFVNLKCLEITTLGNIVLWDLEPLAKGCPSLQELKWKSCGGKID